MWFFYQIKKNLFKKKDFFLLYFFNKEIYLEAKKSKLLKFNIKLFILS